MRKASVFIISFMMAMFCPAFLAGTPQPKPFIFGIYGGWSHGWGYEFGWHSRPSRSDDYTLDVHLGAYIQYNLSPVVGIQGNVNYQHGTNDWTFTYPGFPYDEGTDRFSFFSANLNGVITFWRLREMSFYFLGGGGVTSGDWEDFRGTYFNLTAGLGAKIYVARSHPSLALNLGGTYVRLIDPEKFGDETANYLKFLIGVEF